MSKPEEIITSKYDDLLDKSKINLVKLPYIPTPHPNIKILRTLISKLK